MQMLIKSKKETEDQIGMIFLRRCSVIVSNGMSSVKNGRRKQQKKGQLSQDEENQRIEARLEKLKELGDQSKKLNQNLDKLMYLQNKDKDTETNAFDNPHGKHSKLHKLSPANFRKELLHFSREVQQQSRPTNYEDAMASMAEIKKEQEDASDD